MSFQALQSAIGVNEGKSRRYRDYFRAVQTLRNTSVMAPPELKDSYFTSIPFCRMACQVLSERIEIDSVTAFDSDDAEDKDATQYLRDILKGLGGSDFVNTAHLAAMEYGRSYLVPTGTDREDGLPGVQLVPGRDMVHFTDPYTGDLVEALRVYGPGRTLRAWYTAEATYYMAPGPGAADGPVDGYVVTNRVPTANGRVAVFPLICRDEVTNPWGRPEAKDAFRLQDAACRIATDLAIASGTMSVPPLILFGVEPEDFAPKDQEGNPLVDDDGNPVPGPTNSELYMSRILTISDPAAKLAQAASAQLQNFTTALNSVTRQAAAVLGIPQSVFGVASDANPASGDAQRQDDDRLIRRSELLTRGFEPAWVKLWEYLAELGGFSVTVAIRWVDPRLPNLASRSDAVLKLAGIRTEDGRSLYSWKELRQMLGDSDDDIEKAQDQHEVDQIKGLLTTPNLAPAPAPNQVPNPNGQGQ